jgi:ribonuclease HII
MIIAGVDEAGRGPLAGPVMAAAVILDTSWPIPGLADSKTLTPIRRASLAAVIKQRARCWALGRAEVDDIDRLNILQATLLAMRRAVNGLKLAPELVLVDGKQVPPLGCGVRGIVKGDASVPVIAAASILAKVARDREMRLLDVCFPGYGFGTHKGYATRKHLQALQRYGPTPAHRRSFGPVKQLLLCR